MDPSLKSLLLADLNRQVGNLGDAPCATGWTILTRLLHPRFLPLLLVRLSRWFALRAIPFIPGLCTYCNIVLFGLEVSPKCEIGPGLFLPHTTGTVIGAFRIGKDATIFQGVTLGARQVDMRFDPALRPELANSVTIGAGAKVLGAVHLGDNVTVGANSVVLRSVLPNRTVAGIPAKEIRFAE